MANLKAMNQFRDVDLNNSRMTNSGLEHLKNLPQLQKRHLCGTHVTDAGLHYLEGMTNLDELDISDTKVTAAGVETLLQDLRRLHKRKIGPWSSVIGRSHLDGATRRERRQRRRGAILLRDQKSFEFCRRLQRVLSAHAA
jgi:hypothetical protein